MTDFLGALHDDPDSEQRYLPSMNEATERDPFNNNCFGTLVDQKS